MAKLFDELKKIENNNKNKENKEKAEKSIRFISDNRRFNELEPDDFAPPNGAGDVLAKFFKNMKVTQLHKVFSKVKKLEKDVKKDREGDSGSFKGSSELFLLMPELAYAKGRKLISGEFYQLIKGIVGDKDTTQIKTNADFKKFVQFLTAILAYHKLYAGQ